MNINKILTRYYKPDSTAYNILVVHSEMVAKKSVELAAKVPHLKPDTDFIIEAAMLHDIGVFKTNAPEIGCNGKHPYIFHGFMGKEILDSLGYPKHGLVAERHTGSGITEEDIINNNLGLPLKDRVPVTIEEIIICYADKFFSKSPGSFNRERSFSDVIAMLKGYGQGQAERFIEWGKLFDEGG